MDIFIKRIVHSPKVYDENKANLFLKDLEKKINVSDFPVVMSEIFGGDDDKPARVLVKSMFGSSPYLSQLILRSPHTLEYCLAHSPEDAMQTFINAMGSKVSASDKLSDVMAALRVFKRDVALLTALADLSGVWEVMEVTEALTGCADEAVRQCLDYLLGEAFRKGDYLPSDPENLQEGCGYFVLAMGKHGAYELNYSSDIDLIVFYDASRLKLKSGVEPKVFFVNLTRSLVKLMQERTADGYVFRTDLRLRPDPGSTQVAISTDAALSYYESVGQNWERAVYIKARPMAGDIEAARAFLKELSPFVWRKYLDFASIAEVHAMKRQIHAHKGHGDIGIEGHNIKLGRGGIREIEFFVQTQQLIAGGRQDELRTSPTLVTMERLVEKGWVDREVADSLISSYKFLRTIEHRLQMIADEQTHSLPRDKDALTRIALFSGFEDYDSFASTLLGHLKSVQGHYSVLFEDSPVISVNGKEGTFVGNTVITGEMLTQMGFEDAPKALSMIESWHSGRYSSMRTSQAKARLMDVQLILFEALSETASPDQALVSFDRFLANLPAGVQLFSLLKNNPNLLRLLADIMGTAPRLAHFLSQHSRVLDSVLDPGFFGEVPSEEALATMVRKVITEARDYQDILDGVRNVGQEKAFLIGVRTLSGAISAQESGYAFARLAELIIDQLVLSVKRELDVVNGQIKDGEEAILAMGKLGGREMTASSDLDMIVIYDFDQGCVQSDGAKPLAPTQYYNRFTQRLISSLSAQTSYGNLYEVDMRLRPSGRSGPLATKFDSFCTYQRDSAWTWEHMALTRARIISGSPNLRVKLEQSIKDILTMQRDPNKIAVDVLDMRQKIEKELGTSDHWRIKQVRGGLLDLEFITQYLQLIHAHKHPEILDQNTLKSLTEIAEIGLVTEQQADTLLEAAKLYSSLIQIIRLCVSDDYSPNDAPPGLKSLLVRTSEDPAFSQLEARLQEMLVKIQSIFDEVIGQAANA